MLGNFSCFCCHSANSFLNNFIFRNTVRVSNCLDPDQDGHSVGPDLDSNCLQSLTLKAPITTAADEEFSTFLPFFDKNKV